MYTLFIIIFRLLDLNDNLENYSKLKLKKFDESMKLFNRIQENFNENKPMLMYIYNIMNIIFYKNEREIIFKKII